MKLAIVVLAHRAPAQRAMLLAVLRHPQVRIYLHVDRRADFTPFARALAAACTPDLVLLKRRPSRWGGVELVDAELDGLARGVADGCDYVMVISGQDFPLMPIERIRAKIEDSGALTHLRFWPLPTPLWRFGGLNRTDFYTYTVFGKRETCYPRGVDISNLNWKGRLLNQMLRLRDIGKPARRFPPYLDPYGGWVWWNLNRAAAMYVLAFVAQHPDYRAFHEYTLSPDEIFFQSILLGSLFPEREQIVNDDLRFTIWPPGASHPSVLTERDLPAMLASGKLFARKFDANQDGHVLASLAEQVRG